MGIKRLFSLLVLAFTVFGVSYSATAQTEGNKTEAANLPAEGKKEENKLDVAKVIFGHIADCHEWHLFSIEHEGGKPTEIAFPLPCIVYSPSRGLFCFMSSKIMEGEGHEGFHLVKGAMKEKIESFDGTPLYDLSITKNVLSMFISIFLLLWLALSSAKKYKKNGIMTAPNGFQNVLEIIIIFIRDEVAKPYLGNKYQKYFPLLISVFFFIWINNLLGLLPGGANFTGNIAVTLCLALLSFIVILASSKKHFWMHLINPPGVPLGIKFLLVPIEILSLFIRPMALCIRLFANIIAGHIMILAVISMIFIFAVLSKVVGMIFIPVSLGFSIFMFLLELLVGALQAFIFANLTAVFIGQSMEDPHEAEHGHVAEGHH